MNLGEALKKIAQGGTLERSEMRDVMLLIMTGEASIAQLGALLFGLHLRGETVDELTGAVDAMRKLVQQVPTVAYPLLDTCGTGGSGKKLFNISTAAAFVVAATGVHVSKHGNKAMSGKSGSADVLEEAGADLSLEPLEVGRCIDEVGFGFMFAQAHHSAVRHAASVRAELGVRTLFNAIGPMANPAGAQRQLIGVANQKWQEIMARVLQQLGSDVALTVHCDGLDELGLNAPSTVVELKDNKIKTYQLKPEDVGLQTQSHASLVADSPTDSLALVNDALFGKIGPASDIVALNAGAALYAADVSLNIAQGVQIAQDMIVSGQARQKMTEYIEFTKVMTQTKESLA